MDSLDSCRISVPGSTQVPVRSQIIFVYGTFTLFGRLSHTFPLMIRFLTPICQALQPPKSMLFGFRLLPVRSPLLGEFFLFLWVLRCFSSPGALLAVYRFNYGYRWFAAVGFPIRISPDITPVHGSPRLFAVSHVLLRHLAPRHPP